MITSGEARKNVLSYNIDFDREYTAEIQRIIEKVEKLIEVASKRGETRITLRQCEIDKNLNPHVELLFNNLIKILTDRDFYVTQRSGALLIDWSLIPTNRGYKKSIEFYISLYEPKENIKIKENEIAKVFREDKEEIKK